MVRKMNIQRFWNSVRKIMLVLAVATFSINAGLANAQPPKSPPGQVKKVTQAERQAAADRAAAAGFATQALGPVEGGVPHYFSHANYANSQVPVFSVTSAYFGNLLSDRAYATDFAATAVGQLAPAFIIMSAPLPTGTLTSFQSWNQAAQGASPYPSAGNVFFAYVLRPSTTNPGEYSVVFASDSLTVPALADPSVSELADYPVAPVAVMAGDVLAFTGREFL